MHLSPMPDLLFPSPFPAAVGTALTLTAAMTIPLGSVYGILKEWLAAKISKKRS